MDFRRTTSADELLAICRAARKAGDDFPTVWQEHLERHPLVMDIPMQLMSAGGPVLSVRLLGGRQLLFDEDEVQLR
jgi:hypothetical protein